MTSTVAILEPGYADYGTEAACLEPFGVRIVPIGAGEDAVPSLRALDPVAIMVRERTVGQPEMDACPNLKVVVRYGVGVDNIDIGLAAARGIHVANVADYGAENEVSDHALALYLAVQRRITTRDAEVRAGHWGIGQRAIIPNRENAVLGLIGCGRIGLATARKFRAFGFTRILGHDPSLSKPAAIELGIEPATIESICAEADVISLHAPLTPATHHVLNADRISLMRPEAIVINVSRGGLVDEAALSAALSQGRLFGAGIDVFETEPVSPDNPLLSAPNTIVSDHAAWYSERSVAVLQRSAAEEVARVLNGGTPKNWVNR